MLLSFFVSDRLRALLILSPVIKCTWDGTEDG